MTIYATKLCPAPTQPTVDEWLADHAQWHGTGTRVCLRCCQAANLIRELAGELAHVKLERETQRVTTEGA